MPRDSRSAKMGNEELSEKIQAVLANKGKEYPHVELLVSIAEALPLTIRECNLPVIVNRYTEAITALGKTQERASQKNDQDTLLRLDYAELALQEMLKSINEECACRFVETQPEDITDLLRQLGKRIGVEH